MLRDVSRMRVMRQLLLVAVGCWLEVWVEISDAVTQRLQGECKPESEGSEEEGKSKGASDDSSIE
jgi:hypothetical protein